MEPAPRPRPDLRHVAGATAAVFAVTLGLMVGLLHKGGDDDRVRPPAPQAQKQPGEARQGTQQQGRRQAQRSDRAGARPTPGSGASPSSPGRSGVEPDVMFPPDEGGPPIR